MLALDKADVTAGMRAVATTTLAAILIVAVIAAALVGAMTNAAFKRILLVRDALTDVSTGSGDLTKRLPADGADEAAQIAHAFNLFAEKISMILLQIREFSESVNLASAEIAQGNRICPGGPSMLHRACRKPPPRSRKSPARPATRPMPRAR